MKLRIAAIAVMLSGGLAFAQQDKPAPKAPPAKAAPGGAAGDENTTYKAKTVYDFEDDTVEGDLQRPKIPIPLMRTFRALRERCPQSREPDARSADR